MTENVPNVEFWFDPVCPWCWMTSRWATEVAQVRGFTITWHPVSLAILNEKNTPSGHAAAYAQTKRMGRVIVAAERAHGQYVVSKLYTEFGTRIHPGERDDYDAIIEEGLAAAGLPAELAMAANDEALDIELRDNTDHAIKIAGPDVGVPVISINGVAFFGPVVTPAPTGENALKLWDGIEAAASVPGFYELKRGRSADPQF